MEITEILRRIWLFTANKIKGSESFSKQPTQLIIAADNWLKKVEGKIFNSMCEFFF